MSDPTHLPDKSVALLPWMQASFRKPIYPRCGADARSTGEPCKAKALPNGRCRNHGGLSTGPKTPEGRKAIFQASSQRMASGGKEKALAGLKAWLDAGGVGKSAPSKWPGDTGGAIPSTLFSASFRKGCAKTGQFCVPHARIMGFTDNASRNVTR